MNIWNYLFDPSPGVMGGSGAKILLLFLFGAFLIAVRLAIPVIRRNTEEKALRKVLARSRTGSLSFGLGTIFLVWMRLEQVQILSMRFWVLLLLIGFVVWAVWKILWYRKTKTRIKNAEARRASGK